METQIKTIDMTLNTKKTMLATTLLTGMAMSGQLQADVFKADFNGDGYEDMVWGMPYEDVGDVKDAGAVKVVYGQASGVLPSYSKTAYIHQGKPGESGITVWGVAEAYDNFGEKVAVGDFNDDGYDDLAIATPRETHRGHTLAGIVNVIYGSAEGLHTYKGASTHELHMSAYQSGKYQHDFNNFGTGMTVGDFDGDQVDDLAVGFPGFSFADKPYTGGIAIFFGTREKGLRNAEASAKTYVMMDYKTQPIQFGSAMTSGDFDNDGYDDLAVGAYRDTVAGVIESGSVYVAFGHGNWVNHLPKWEKIEPAQKTIKGQFGYTLTAGNFDRDAQDELIIGSPRAQVNGKSSGAVILANFQTDGRILQRYIHQDLSYVPGKSQSADGFGRALTTADFNQDGYDDVAIGVSGKTDFAPIFNDWAHGEVIVMYGSRWTGPYRSERWEQDTPGVEGGRESYDYFGSAVSAGDFNNDGYPDLLVGVSGEDLGSSSSKKDVGVVQMIWGRSSGLTATISGKQLYHQGNFNSAGFGSAENEKTDRLGFSLP